MMMTKEIWYGNVLIAELNNRTLNNAPMNVVARMEIIVILSPVICGRMTNIILWS